VLLISLQQCDFTDSRTKSQWGGLSPGSSGLDGGEKKHDLLRLSWCSDLAVMIWWGKSMRLVHLFAQVYLFP
jgi:hypothetical protein